MADQRKPPDDAPDAPFSTTGPVMDAEGRVHRPSFEPARFERPPLAPAPVPADEEPLELAERAPKVYTPTPESYRDEVPPPTKRRGVLVVLALLGLAGAVVAVVLLAPRSTLKQLRVDELDRQLRPSPHSLLITSEPSGATVRIGGTVVGTTPFASDNLWGDGAVTVELRGYQKWTGQLKAGQDVVLEATLRR